jgi:PIN domain nuclease of toxin-antitoxin system
VIVIDTHILLWWYGNRRRLSKVALRTLRSAKMLSVAAISLWEVAFLVERGRVRLDEDVEVWLEELLLEDEIELLPLTPAIAARSQRLGVFHGDPADRLIVATALCHGGRLVTADEAIHKSGVVQTIW